jgi:hypothetical protein
MKEDSIKIKYKRPTRKFKMINSLGPGPDNLND